MTIFLISNQIMCNFKIFLNSLFDGSPFLAKLTPNFSASFASSLNVVHHCSYIFISCSWLFDSADGTFISLFENLCESTKLPLWKSCYFLKLTIWWSWFVLEFICMSDCYSNERRMKQCFVYCWRISNAKHLVSYNFQQNRAFQKSKFSPKIWFT